MPFGAHWQSVNTTENTQSEILHLTRVDRTLVSLQVWWMVPLTVFFLWYDYLPSQDFGGQFLGAVAFGSAVFFSSFSYAKALATFQRGLRWREAGNPLEERRVDAATSAPAAPDAQETKTPAAASWAGRARWRPSRATFDTRRLGSRVFLNPPSNTVDGDEVDDRPRQIRVLGVATPGTLCFLVATYLAVSVTTLPLPRGWVFGDESYGVLRALNEKQLEALPFCSDRSRYAEARTWCYWLGADLKGARLDSATLSGRSLRQAFMSGANLAFANLERTHLEGAQLSDANMHRARLKDAYLRNAILWQAKLDSANLKEADLRGADLRGADLRGAQLQGANLVGAKLRGRGRSQRARGDPLGRLDGLRGGRQGTTPQLREPPG
jgi:hypothetical protein